MDPSVTPPGNLKSFGNPPPLVTYIGTPGVSEPKTSVPNKFTQKFPFSQNLTPGKKPLWTTLRPVVADLNEYLRPKNDTPRPLTILEDNQSPAVQVKEDLQALPAWDRKSFQRKSIGKADNTVASGATTTKRDSMRERVRQRILYVVGTEPTAMHEKITAMNLFNRDEIFLQDAANEGEANQAAVLQQHKLSKALRERFELLGKDTVEGLRIQVPQRLVDRQLNLNYTRKQYFVLNGIETTTSMEIPDSWLDNILNQLEFYLIKKFPDTVKKLAQDARYEFLKGIKRYRGKLLAHTF